MKLSNLLNIVLAVALVALSYQVATSGNSKRERNDMDKEQIIVDNIMTRASVRSYASQPVESEKIDRLVRAGMAAPTAMDKRPWHFVVVTDKAVLQQIAQLTPNAGMAANAPLAIVVCGDMTKAAQDVNKDYWIQDVSAATLNILLAAHGMGLGAVWTGVWPRQERCEAIDKLLGLPSTMIAFSTIVIGYPDGDTPAKDKYVADNVSYNTYGNTAAQTDISSTAASEPQVKTFHEIDITRDFNENAFNYFMKNHGLILAAGDKNSSNAMTIGWGGLGKLWQRNVATVYVASGRYTHEFMEHSPYFTIMEFSDPAVARYMGSHSGRDGDKAAALGLHLAYTDNGAPYYEEADVVIECRLMYKAPFDPNAFTDDVPRNFYDGFKAGYHSEYIGEVVKVMRKQ